MKNGKNKSQEVIEQTNLLLKEFGQMTLRQIFYQLVVRQIIKNTQNDYKYLSKILVRARKEYLVNPFAVIDESRELEGIQMWSSLDSFLDSVLPLYSRDIWNGENEQESYIEVWLEKQALGSQFRDAIDKFRVNLLVTRGYPSYSAILEAQKRIPDDKPVILLLFYDFDPTGRDIVRHVQSELGGLGNLTVEKVAVTEEQIKKFNLPPLPAKRTDSRYREGDVQVELDSLRPDILKEIVETAVKKHFDYTSYQKVLDVEKLEKERLTKLVKEFQESD